MLSASATFPFGVSGSNPLRQMLRHLLNSPGQKSKFSSIHRPSNNACHPECGEGSPSRVLAPEAVKVMALLFPRHRFFLLPQCLRVDVSFPVNISSFSLVS